MQVIYLGFSQRENIRTFRFEGVPKRQPGQVCLHTRLVMTMDMGIMSRHRLSLQELPELCLRKLAGIFESYESYTGQATTYIYSEADVCSHFASLPPPAARKPVRFHKPTPSAANPLATPAHHISALHS